MAVVRRANVSPPVAPAETLEVAGVGEVIVRGLLLRDRLRMAIEDPERPYANVSRLLAVSVVDADHAELWAAEEWEAYGAAHWEECLRLWAVARRLSGMDGEGAEKK